MALLSKKAPVATPAPPPAKPRYAAEPEREALRAQHQVRPVTEAEEGTGWKRLPNGVYGFVHVPVLDEFPIFRDARRHTFEVHKCIDGEIVLVGYVSVAAAAQMESNREPIEIKFFAGLSADAPQLAAAPFSRLIRIKDQAAREDGTLILRLAPPPATM